MAPLQPSQSASSSSLSSTNSSTLPRIPSKFRLKKEPAEKVLFHPRQKPQISTGAPLGRPRPSPRPKPQIGPNQIGSQSIAPGSSGSNPIDVDAKPVIKHSPSPAPRNTPTPTPGSSDVKTSGDAAAESKPKYTDFKLLSCDRHGWRYDVMKLDSRQSVDIDTWEKPVKLNRKEPKRPEVASTQAVAVGPMLGPDGKPVIGADGRIVMVGADGKPIQENANVEKPVEKDKEKDKNKKKKMQKKPKQVFLVPEHIRALRREERYPWILEDGSGSEVWVGRMEEAAKSEMHALFMPAPDSVFRFVPAHRWYKFQKKRQNAPVLSLEEAEKLMAKMAKSKDAERWLLRQRAEGVGTSLVHDAGGRSLGPGGRRLKTVDTGMRGLFEEDDEEGVGDDVRRRRQRERGAEGELDEFEFEEEFADDDEQIQPDGAEDEEAKELEERLKREYRNANKTREGYIDESEEEDEGEHLTGAGKAMKKLVRKVDKSGTYDSDDDENPYASSEEEEEEDEIIPTQTQAEAQLQQQQQQQRELSQQGGTPSRSGSIPPRTLNATPNGSKVPSRTGSPAPGSSSLPSVKLEASPPPASPPLGMGGHSVVAKRATSPKAPGLKLKTSPPPPGLSQSGSRATSPLNGTGSRASSPTPNVPTSLSGPLKRKAEETSAASPTSAGAPHKHKKRKAVPGATSPTAASGSSAANPPLDPNTELSAELLINWLRATANATTRECIQHFQPCLKDDAKKSRFTALVKEVATLKGGVLVLKTTLQDGEQASV